jgi:hypothetical protein
VLCGDFDVQVDFAVTGLVSGVTGGIFASMRAHDLTVTTNGMTIERYAAEYPIPSSQSSQNYKSYTTNLGDDATSVFVPTTDVTGRLRLTRTGTTVKSYYWKTGTPDGQWVLVNTATLSSTPWVLVLYEGDNSAANKGPTAPYSVTFSNLLMTSPGATDAGTIGRDAPIALDAAQIDSGAKATGDGSVACVAGEVASVTAGPSFYNTGVDDGNQQLSGGSLDPHYQMRQVSGGDYTGNPNWTSAVAMASSITWSAWNTPSDARWIYVADAVNLGQDWGTYEFMTTFDLTGYDPATAVLAGKWALDQDGTIYLNGNLVATLPDQNWNSNLTSPAPTRSHSLSGFPMVATG